MTAVDITYQFRTKPFAHQRDCFRKSRNEKVFAFLMEQGTGKTWVGINTAGALYETNKIDALVVVAPNEGDIPEVWLEQLATHLPKRIHYTGVRARGETMMKAAPKRLLQFILDGKGHDELGLRVITINIESMRKGMPLFDKLLKFCRSFRVLVIVDESTRIAKNSSSQTRGMLKIGANADYKRIATGTLISNGGPLDAYSQFAFLDPDILGFDSYSAYKAHYCELLPPFHPLVQFTAKKMAKGIIDPGQSHAYSEKMRSILQLPARDANGRVIYKNVPELNKRIERYSYRVLKKDCLDLPPKLYAKRFVEMTALQKKIYAQVRDEIIAEFEHMGRLNTITCQIAITRLLRLQQVLCNHYCPDPDPDEMKGDPLRIEEMKWSNKQWTVTNPRMKALLGIIEDEAPGVKGIIWCRHHAEIRECVETLERLFGAEKVVQLHGKVKGEARTAARHAFQKVDGCVQWLVGQIRSGIGIDLFEASWETFYSNDYSLENRKQAEDRAHRIGLKHNLTIYDLIAPDTLDVRIVDSLRALEEISDVILGDHPRNWI